MFSQNRYKQTTRGKNMDKKMIPHPKGYLHLCEKCGKEYRYLQDGQIVIHTCNPEKDNIKTNEKGVTG